MRIGLLPRAALLCALAGLPPAHAQDAASLQARHAALRDVLAHNAFQRPLHLESREGAGELHGDVYARIAQPFAEIGPALEGLAPWCDILILHLNVKQCRVAATPAGAALHLDIGRKFDQPLADAYRFEFAYAATARHTDYLRVVLSAAQGPLGTSRYRIVLEIAALDASHSVVHLSYSYAQGAAARWAAQAYLATVGRAKVGFSIVGRHDDGRPIYIGSTRGVIERNAMRCYLAIEAYLGALATPPAQQRDKRLEDWFAAVERYPLQLHEMERDEYLRMKLLEIRRQRGVALAGGGG